MGVGRVVFETAGQRSEHIIPGVYTRNNFEPKGGGGVSANNGVIVGVSQGGEPRKVLYFSSPSEARAVLRSGAGLEGVLHAFDPGNGLVPQRIGFIRVNQGVQAASALKNGSDTMIDLKAWDWGLHGNQVKRKFSAGTAAGSHKIQVQFGTNTEEVFDNITHPSLSIQYIGAGAAANVTVNATGLSTTVDAVADLNLDFASFPTISDLVNRINDDADYQAVILTGDDTELCENLDHYTAVAIKASAATIKSDLFEIIETFKRSAYIGDASHPAAVTARKVPDYDAAYVYFTGGANGTSDTQAYTDTLVVLEAEDVQIIATTTTEEAVHLLIADHCRRMSGVEGRKERMAWVGGATGETVAAVKTRATHLTSDLVSLAYPWFKSYDVINPALGIKDQTCAMLACKLMGMEVSLAVNEPVTNKELQVLSFGKTLKKSETEELLAAGVAVCGKSDDGVLVAIRGLTTFQGNVLQRNERSMVREAQYMARDFRAAVRGNIGRAGSVVSPGTIKAILKTKGVEWYNSGYILKGDGQDLVWGITLSEDGDAIFVAYHTYLTAPRNFIFGTANLHVLTQQTVSV